MAMKMSMKEFLGISDDEMAIPSPEVVAYEMALDFESNVYDRMKELGLKKKDLAELLGVKPSTISKILDDNSNMTLKTIARVAVALGCIASAPSLKVFDSEEYYYGCVEGDSVVATSDSVYAGIEHFDYRSNAVLSVSKTLEQNDDSVSKSNVRKVAA